MTNAADRDQILEAMTAYVQAVDDRDLAKLAQVFDERTVWISNRGTFTGVEAVGRALTETAGRPESRPRHLVSNVSVAITGDYATAVSDWYLLQPGSPWQITAAGRYHDRLRRSGGRWVFAVRDIRHLVVAEGPAGTS
jgi:ketosteroid isomerase-like protein